MTDYNIPREHPPYSRPLLYTPTSDKRVAYSRPSTLGKDLDDGKGLVPWEQVMVITGLKNKPYLQARINAILARGGGWATDKKQLKAIMAEAKEAANWKGQADRGSALHDFADAAEQGILDESLVPDDLKGPVLWYQNMIVPKLKIIATECFVAVDDSIELPNRPNIELRAAGSIDRIAEYNGERYIVDIKSGRDDEFRLSVCGQLYLYSIGKLYADDVVDQDQKPEFDWADWFPSEVNPSLRAVTGVNTERAIMLQAPKRAVKGEWAWRCHWIPLATGRDIIECGQWARKCRNVKEFEEFAL